jgi:L-threonylcarbamoyladenylate synthase
MVADQTQLTEWIFPVNAGVQKILDEHWPGALTVVFRKKYNKDTLGVRIPDNEFMLSLFKEWGRPLAVTSANISGEAELNNIAEIRKYFDEKIDLYIESNSELSGIASTVIDVSGEDIKVLRQGEVKI